MILKLSPEEYDQMVKRHLPKTKSYKTIPAAFLVGGLICVLGEALADAYTAMGVSEELCGTAVSITLVFLSALFTGLNLYPKLAKFAGAGTLVPITGFANSVVSPALEFKTEGLILGLGAKLFIIAGPVLTYGVSASVVYGFFYWLWSIR